MEYVFFHFNLRRQAGLPDGELRPDRPASPAVPLRLPAGQAARAAHRSLPLRPGRKRKRRRPNLDPRPARKAATGSQARMAASTPGYAISLSTTPTKPVLLHGGTGYEQYGPVARAGYYSLPAPGHHRHPRSGRQNPPGDRRAVVRPAVELRRREQESTWPGTGSAFSSTSPARRLMLYTVHNTQNRPAHQPAARINGPPGRKPAPRRSRLSAGAPHVLDQPQSKKKYPATWHVQCPARATT
ncbi:MAG: lipocalin-like domain-containing protein [Hymenobacter sp.]